MIVLPLASIRRAPAGSGDVLADRLDLAVPHDQRAAFDGVARHRDDARVGERDRSVILGVRDAGRRERAEQDGEQGLFSSDVSGAVDLSAFDVDEFGAVPRIERVTGRDLEVGVLADGERARRVSSRPICCAGTRVSARSAAS